MAAGFEVEPHALAQLGGQLRWAAVDLAELDLAGPGSEAAGAASGSGTAQVLPALLLQLGGALNALADGVRTAGEALAACAHGYQRADQAVGASLDRLAPSSPAGPAGPR